MRKLHFLFAICLLSSCAYKSINVSSKIKRSTIININAKNDTIPQDKNSILTDPVSLEFLKRIDGNSDHGQFSIFITTDSTYIEAKSTVLTKDSISIRGIVLFNQKRDTLHFKLSYRYKIDPVNLTKLSDNSYTVKFKDNSGNNKDSSSTYALTKVKNFIIQDNMLELLTGEAQKNNGKLFKYVVLNDPSKPDYYLTSIKLLDGAFLSDEDYNKYTTQCREHKVIKCKNGYDIDLDFQWTKFYVICKCL